MPESKREIAKKDVDRLLRETFTNDFRTGYITVKDVCLPEYYEKFAEAIENFEVRNDDVWVCSFPKTGTTWTQEMVWCIANDLDFDGARTVISERFPFLEHSALFDYSTILPRTPELNFPELVLDSVSFVEKMSSPRFIKTHLPYNLLPREIRDGTKKPKIIYVARNAKDTCVSYYNHCKLLEGYRGNFQDFCDLFLAGKLSYASFWKHVVEFWKRRNNGNILFLKYEDMKTDLESVIRRTADFLGKNANGDWTSDNAATRENVDELVKHLSFENMKINTAVNYEDVVNTNRKFDLIQGEGTFMRKGERDQWKREMDLETCERFDRMTRENFGNCNLVF